MNYRFIGRNMQTVNENAAHMTTSGSKNYRRDTEKLKLK